MRRVSAPARGRKYAFLLEDEGVRRWYENVARGSDVTADVYLRRLGNFCHDLKLTPKGLLKKSESQLYNILLDTVSTMEKEGSAGSYIQSTVKAVKSWLLHNRIEVRGKIKIKGTQDTPTLKDERVPTKNLIARALESSNCRIRIF